MRDIFVLSKKNIVFEVTCLGFVIRDKEDLIYFKYDGSFIADSRIGNGKFFEVDDMVFCEVEIPIFYA